MKYLILAALILCLPVITHSTPQQLLVDNFDSDTVGFVPAGWSLAKPVAGTSAVVANGTPAGNKWTVLHDDNAPGNLVNNTLFRGFTPAASGRVTAQFDVKLSQTTAGFGTRLTI